LCFEACKLKLKEVYVKLKSLLAIGWSCPKPFNDTQIHKRIKAKKEGKKWENYAV